MWLILVDLKKYYRLLIVLTFLSCELSKQHAFQRVQGFALGTTYSISYHNPKLDSTTLEKAVDSIINVMNQSMSTYVKDSDISKINRGDSLLEIDKHFEKVYRTASEVWKKTQGYFDPTVGSLVNAYGFGPESGLKELSEIKKEALLAYTGWEKTFLTQKKTIQKGHPKLYFDFNALAKGYAVDVIAEYLRSLSLSSFLVEIGGEIVAEGLSPKTGGLWKVAIDDPQQKEDRKFIKVISLKDEALATSGNYRKYKIDQVSGRRLVHSVNPKTGDAFPTNVLSASVIAPNCMLADAYATALMVMPFEKSKTLIERETLLEAYWIIETETGAIEEVVSSGFTKE
jgi:thiamine biosynthesis lipoprotein